MRESQAGQLTSVHYCKGSRICCIYFHVVHYFVSLIFGLDDIILGQQLRFFPICDQHALETETIPDPMKHCKKLFCLARTCNPKLLLPLGVYVAKYQESKRVEQAAAKDEDLSKFEAEVSQKLKCENEGNRTW